MNNSAISNLQDIFKKQKVRQISSLYFSMVFAVIIGIGVSIVNTRLLGPQQYGNLKFLQNLFNFGVSFLTFGIFVSGSKLLAHRSIEKIRQQLIGNLMILASIISLMMIFGFLIFSFYEESIFNNKLGHIIRIFSPLLFVFPFKICLEKIMQGDNRIYELSFLNTVPQLLYLTGAITFNYFFPLSLFSALSLQLFILSAVIIIMVIRLKPKFQDIRMNISNIWLENKAYGFHVYIGSLSAVTSGHLAGLCIAYFIDNVNVGFYALAITVTIPLTMIPTAVGTTFFKDFANSRSIPKKATVFTIILSLCSFVFFILVIDKIIILLYSFDYSPVIPLAYLLSVGSIAYGLGEYLNKFLGAHGCGKAMRNGSIIVGVVNIVGLFILVMYIGVIGAAITKIISSFTYLCVRYYPYHRLVKNLNSG